MKPTKKLLAIPSTLSGLLRVAVHDSKLVAKDRRFKLNMFVWGDQHEDLEAPCSVCMAGAVIAHRSPGALLRVVKDRALYPGMLELDICRKLYAVDYMRAGKFVIAYDFLTSRDGLSGTELPAGTTLTVQKATSLINKAYDCRKARAPWSAYLKAADLLEAVGL